MKFSWIVRDLSGRGKAMLGPEAGGGNGGSEHGRGRGSGAHLPVKHVPRALDKHPAARGSPYSGDTRLPFVLPTLGQCSCCRHRALPWCSFPGLGGVCEELQSPPGPAPCAWARPPAGPQPPRCWQITGAASTFLKQAAGNFLIWKSICCTSRFLHFCGKYQKSSAMRAEELLLSEWPIMLPLRGP